jgi:hypothetical protein
MLLLFPSFRPAEKARVTPALVDEQISTPSVVQYTLPANLALEFSAADPGSGAFFYPWIWDSGREKYSRLFLKIDQ